jgi:diguanylate cyclase (GGDEF)-like protein
MNNKLSLLRIINLFSLLLFIVFISYVFVDFNAIFKTLEDIQETKIKEYIKAKNSIIAPLIKYHFYDEAKEELKNLDNNIKYLKIVTKNNFSYEIGNKNNLKIVKMPLIYKHKTLGYITIGYDDKKLLNSFSKRYVKKVVIYLSVILLILLISYLFLKKKISSLNLLAKKIENLDFKKTINIKLLDNYYEIKNITNSINKLLNQIHSFYNHQKKLMKKIILFKKQLEAAQKLADMFTWEYDCENKKFSTHNFYITKKRLGFIDFEDFLNSFLDKENFFNELQKACKENYEFELLFKLKKDNEYYFKVQGKTFIRDNKSYIIGVFINITEEIKKQQQIEYLAYHDPLTGLINRSYLKEELEILINLANRNNKKLAVVFIDIDNFKYINDTFGHDVGDILLVKVSKRLKNSVRKSDVVSRIGGDEFILVLNNIDQIIDINKVLDKLKNTLTKPIYIKDLKLQITFSAGISIYPNDAKNIEDLLKFADIAMYESKKQGKNRYSFITENLKKEIKEYYISVNELKEALEQEDELILYFQPKVSVTEKKVVGAEALIRWNHPKKGLLTPFHFINIAEKANLITKIDDYVLEKGIKTLKNWQTNDLLKDLSLAINISANKFKEKNFINNLENLIDKYQIEPQKLQIEITETLSMQDINYTIEMLNKIKSLGVKIALDDFGTGYSSLNYLKKLPFDVLKIDQTFVRDLLDDKDDLVITKMIIEISKILNKTEVAEGVENRKILEIVTNLGASIIQGYYFSKPLSEIDFKNYVTFFDYNNYI